MNWRATGPRRRSSTSTASGCAPSGADNDLTEALLANRNYTPIDMAVLVAALDNMNGIEDRAVFLQRAAHIDSRSLAYFMRRQRKC